MSNFSKKKETIERRKQQCVLKCYTLKIDNKSIKKNKEYFKLMFLEAKWLYNFLLSQEDIFSINISKVKSVLVKLHDGTYEERLLKHLSSQMKQSLFDKLKDNIKVLSSLKKKGKTIGKLKFKSEISSIILKQFNSTYSIEDNKLYIQGLKNPLKVYGLEQLIKAAEIGMATLVKSPSGFYLKVTVYENKELIVLDKKVVSLDFNVSNTLVLSTGQQIDKVSIKESKRLKKLQKKQSKKVKGSNNRNKLNKQIAKEHETLTNKKNDLSNKICNKLKPYKIVIQNDNLNQWKTNKRYNSKTVQHSILGRIKTKLKSFETTKVIGQYELTTNTCYSCNERLYLTTKDRVFTCPKCGHTDFRDLNAAKNIMKIGLVQSEYKPLESEIDFSSIDGIKVKKLTMKEENSNIYVE